MTVIISCKQPLTQAAEMQVTYAKHKTTKKIIFEVINFHPKETIDVYVLHLIKSLVNVNIINEIATEKGELKKY